MHISTLVVTKTVISIIRMMKTLFTFVICTFLLNQSHSQEDLSGFSFNSIDTIFNQAKIIGAGESTHGTSEFTSIRLDLFKYLVKQHNFNTFFLEADYSSCQRINRYIHGDNDDPERALLEVKLWPWLTYEMIEIIEWCKSYNNEHSNKLNFVGCDMQLITDDHIELKRMFNPDLAPSIDSIFIHLESTVSDSIIRLRQQRWSLFKKEIDNSVSSDNDKKEFQAITKTIDQWFAFQLNDGNTYNFRDSCMAKNMIEYLEIQPESKGMYFAHNYHISNTVYSRKNLDPIKTTGAYLKEHFKYQYFSMGCISRELNFNALTCKDGNIQMHQFHLSRDTRKTVEKSVIEDSSNAINIVMVNTIKNIEKLTITEIGAAYEKNCNGVRPYYQRRLKVEMFDCFLYIKKSKPTHLLPATIKKYSSTTEI